MNHGVSDVEHSIEFEGDGEGVDCGFVRDGVGDAKISMIWTVSSFLGRKQKANIVRPKENARNLNGKWEKMGKKNHRIKLTQFDFRFRLHSFQNRNFLPFLAKCTGVFK